MGPIENLALSLVVTVAVASTSPADVRLSIRNGRISIVAKDATVAEILEEWTRIGQTKIENVDVLPGDRLTIELTDVTEEQALDVLLRRAGGFLAVPRPDAPPE